MFSIRSIVTTIQSPTVVTDGIAVVAGAGHAVRVLGQREARQGERHRGAELLAEPYNDNI